MPSLFFIYSLSFLVASIQVSNIPLVLKLPLSTSIIYVFDECLKFGCIYWYCLRFCQVSWIELWCYNIVSYALPNRISLAYCNVIISWFAYFHYLPIILIIICATYFLVTFLLSPIILINILVLCLWSLILCPIYLLR